MFPETFPNNIKKKSLDHVLQFNVT
jgi:hypothetical protein